MMKNHTIGGRLFFSTAIILLTTIVATLLFGSSLIERYYLHNKEAELMKAYQTFALSLSGKPTDQQEKLPIADILYDLEKSNINIMLFTLNDDGTVDKIIYTSRYNNWSETESYIKPSNIKPDYNPYLWLDRARMAGVFNMDITASPVIIYSNEDSKLPHNTIDLYSYLPSGYYLFLSTPKEQISLAAKLATQYYVILAFITLILLTIATYFQAKRFSRPIQAIDYTAQRISQMDFSQPCNIKTGDELQNLSNSINIMAQNLQDYIAEMHLNQELLQKDLERETKTNSMRREFIASVSHDFKTPLTLIRAYTEDLAAKNPDDEELLDSCQIILKEDERMTSLVTQLLQLSKLEGGVGVLETSLFPIDEDIREIINSSKILLEAKNIRLQFDPNGDEEHLVYGDYSKIQQVLHNLFENALKYCPENGEINIHSVNIAPNKYRFSIINSVEQPLTAEELEDIFISFHRLDKARSSDGKNFGLGLAIVKAIMDLHRQDFGAYNLPEKKICFYFELDADTDIDNADIEEE